MILEATACGLPRRINELVAQYGTIRNTGRHLGLDAAYLSRLRNGIYTNPSDEVLEKLGLMKVITYHRVQPKCPP